MAAKVSVVDMSTDAKVQWGLLLRSLAMTGRLIDRTEQRFGKLVVIAQAGRNRLKKVLWRCRCDCGTELDVPSGSLVTGNTTSCGCYLKERITKHGGTGRASYNTWRAMMRRCYNNQDKDYQRYGAKGVTVCNRWHEYVNFVADMGEPNGDETLDRIDTYGNYTPENCRWAGVKTQNRNVRLRPTNKTGHIGVSVFGKKFRAQITANNKTHYSKVCPTLEEAIAARKQLECAYWGVS